MHLCRYVCLTSAVWFAHYGPQRRCWLFIGLNVAGQSTANWGCVSWQTVIPIRCLWTWCFWYQRLASGIGAGNSTVDHACQIGRIIGSVSGMHFFGSWWFEKKMQNNKPWYSCSTAQPQDIFNKGYLDCQDLRFFHCPVKNLWLVSCNWGPNRVKNVFTAMLFAIWAAMAAMSSIGRSLYV